MYLLNILTRNEMFGLVQYIAYIKHLITWEYLYCNTQFPLFFINLGLEFIGVEVGWHSNMPNILRTFSIYLNCENTIPTLSMIILILRITFTTPRSFMSNTNKRNFFVPLTRYKSVPKMSMSYTYKLIITHDSPFAFEYTHISLSLDFDSLSMRVCQKF